MTTQEFIDHYYILGTRTSGKKIPIKVGRDDPLCTLIFTMHRLARSQGIHHASRAHMLYVIEAMAPAIFNWEEALLSVFKDQLTKC